MKNTEIVKCLKANKKISDYELTSVNKESKELFYVLKHLEVNRAVNVTTQIVTVYVDSKDLKGSSTVVVTAADDQKSLSKKLNNAVKACKNAMNKYYPLPTNQTPIKEDGKDIDLNEVANKIAQIIAKASDSDKGWINSAEIFVSKNTTEFISSKNIHHKSVAYDYAFELIPTYTNGIEEIELYRFYDTNVTKYEEIERKIKGILKKAQDRSNAKTLKEVKIDKNIKVLVKNDMITKIMGNFKDNLNYSSIYTRQSHYEIGSTISDSKFTMKLNSYVKGCSKSRSFDAHGIALKEKTIIKNGKAVSMWGDPRFGYYLNQKEITGDLPIIEVSGPSYDYEKEKHIIIENFSSPQLEATTGYFGGEVRLARYFDGKKYIPLTGFAISGNIYEAIKDAKFSKRKVTLPTYKGPKYLILDHISIN